MKVPVSWLREYVDFDDAVEGLAEKLTFSGTEVEGIETVGSDYAGMVVGEVRKVERHPDADRLTLCTVFDGKEEKQVVCGAPNVREGMKSPFAPVGSVLADGTKLKKAKIRGVESQGMLCAEDELGLSDDHAGIIELDGTWEAGTPLSDVFGPPDVVLDLEITPNRPDCLSMIGIAREVAAMYRTRLRLPEFELAESDAAVEELTKVCVDDPAGCPRYTARVLKDIVIGPAPQWMQRRLTLAGIRPINNIVDITNYVLLECGHPLHAFDQTLLDGGRIGVRRAKKGEKIATLDEIDRELTTDMLVITDAMKPVAVAGVMGGAGSEIRDDTSTVLLESACFDQSSVRHTSKALGLTTESSYRFSRGVDIGGVEWASQRAAALMAEHAGAKIARGVIDVYPKPAQATEVPCTWRKVNSLLGLQASADEMTLVFESLGLEVKEPNEEGCTVVVPSFRRDLTREVDLIEEFSRIHGLDKIPSPFPRAEVVPDAEDRHARAVKVCRDHLVGLGLREIMNYSLVSEQLLDLFDSSNKDVRIVLPHPISADQSVLRTSLIPQMVETIGRNRARQISEGSFFEIGRAYFKDGKGTREVERLSIGLLGPVGRPLLKKRQPLSNTEAFLWVKGALEALLEAQGICDWSVQPKEMALYEPGQSMSILIEGKEAGSMGLVRKRIRSEWRLSDPVPVIELSVLPLLTAFQAVSPIRPVAQYPSVVRDMAILLPEAITHAQIMEIITNAAPKELESARLFDIFSGEGLGDGMKSMAYSLTYRSLERTMTDEEANGLHEAVKDAVRKALGVEVREG
ncbi:MAG: phenylalanine--tRNA ligase subunit beta [Verrucomicrobia bacterium]|nr:phenylalanine--tRNA ligase subunit beta [Verrucomicrobiota bacterium]